jgi:hypothetical protein
MEFNRKKYSSRGKKPDYTRESIKSLIDDGWYFRKKKVDGNWYITRRKKQNERSLGRYDDDLWYMIEEETGKTSKKEESKKIPQKLNVKNNKIDYPKKTDIYEPKDKLQEGFSINRGLFMSINCLHIADGFCKYWTWDKKPSFFKTFDEEFGPKHDFYGLIDDVVKGKIVKRWAVRAYRDYCRNCPSYLSLKDIMFVEAFKYIEMEKIAGSRSNARLFRERN